MNRGASVRRVDDRLGLAVCRVGLSGRTLTTYARDHVTVRTPSRPDFRDGNTLDLLTPPIAEELPAWIDRFHDTIGIMGAPHIQLRWEVAADPATPPATPAADPELAAACHDRGFELSPVTVLFPDRLVGPPRTVSCDFVPVEPPSAVAGGAVDRRWHAATVLYRYAHGDTPAQWRTMDDDFTAWSVDVQRELATGGRCQVWVAMRHGAPVARLSLSHDRQGLAAVDDLIVHPVHRRLGIASALTHHAVSAHLRLAPGARIGIGAVPGSAAERLYHRLGFRAHATVWTARAAG